MKYRINLKSHLILLSNLGFFIGCLLLVLGYLLYEDDIDLSIIEIFIWTIIFFTVPMLWLHIEYYQLNKDTVLINNEENRELIINGKCIQYSNITTLKYVMDRQWHEHSVGRSFPFNLYHYVIVTLSDNSKYVITSLLCSDIQVSLKSLESIKDIKIEKKKRIFCSPWWLE